MEFPEDILEIIRAFSKPVFRHAKEFREILKVLRLSSWLSIQAKLCSPNADQVIRVFRLYREAFVAKEEIRMLTRHLREEYPPEFLKHHLDLYNRAVTLQNL
jgi:hypothetical protein